MKLKNSFFVDIFMKNSENKVEKCLQKLQELNLINEKEENSELQKKIINLLKTFKLRWNAASRVYPRFLTRNQQWLEVYFNFDFKKASAENFNQKFVGRPQKPFSESLPSTKKIKIYNHSEAAGNDVQLGLLSAKLSAKRCSEKITEQILNEVIKNQQFVHAKLFKKDVGIKKLSGLEALAFLFDLSLTKDQYIKIRLQTIDCGVDIYPAYEKLREAKLEIRPEGIEVQESKAFVSYQNLINTTTRRIVEMEKDVVSDLLSKENTTNLKLVFNTGFDSASGFSKYHQKFIQEEKNDDCLIVAVLIPLQLMDEKGKLLWINPTPHSVNFVRPVLMEFARETKDMIKEIKEDIDFQLENIESVTVTLPNFGAVNVFPDVHQTAFDGKVRAVITSNNKQRFFE